MDKNVRIARELVKIAKSLTALTTIFDMPGMFKEKVTNYCKKYGVSATFDEDIIDPENSTIDAHIGNHENVTVTMNQNGKNSLSFTVSNTNNTFKDVNQAIDCAFAYERLVKLMNKLADIYDEYIFNEMNDIEDGEVLYVGYLSNYSFTFSVNIYPDGTFGVSCPEFTDGEPCATEADVINKIGEFINEADEQYL